MFGCSSCKIVGAVWVRIMNDYGHIDNEYQVNNSHLE